MTYNNINVDRSIVGAINTGQLGKLDLAMSEIRSSGDSELADQLKSFTQAVIDSDELSTHLKNEIVEHLAFLASQAALSQNERQRSVAKAAIGAVERAVGNAGALASLWQLLQPVLEGLFQ